MRVQLSDVCWCIRVNECWRRVARNIVEENREKKQQIIQIESKVNAKPTHACVEIIFTKKKYDKFCFASFILQVVCVCGFFLST